MKSVKTKIMVLVLCCIAVSAAAVGGASIINSERVVTADSTKIMNLLCANRAEQIDSLLSRIEQSVQTLTVYTTHHLDSLERLSSDTAYAEEYTDSLLDIATNAAQNTEGALTVYVRFSPEIAGPTSGLFCAKNQTGQGFDSLPPTDLSIYSSSDTAHVGWYFEPVKNGTGTWMSPYLNENIGVEIISYVIPVVVENRIVGVVGMDIDFSVLEEIVGATSIYDSGYAFLTNEKAQILYHKELPPRTDLVQFNGGEFRETALMLQSRNDNGDRLIAYSYGSEKKEAAFRCLKNGMRLVLTSSVKEINAQANQLILQITGAVFIIIFLAFISTIAYTRRLVQPLLELTTAAKKIADGDLSVSISHRSEDEVGALAESFRQTVAHLHKYISYINELAYRDSLTGVKNKTAYLEAILRLEEMTRLKRPQYAVIVFDINNLKLINDTKGHDFGDMLIIGTTGLICKVFRHSPVFRIGGDEFVVLLEDSDYDNYSQLLRQLQTEIDNYNVLPQNEVKISVARGAALYEERSDLTYNDVFKRADSAMYRNKMEIKNMRPETISADTSSKENPL